MNSDQFLSLLRSLLKILGAACAARGYGDASTIEAVIGAIMALAGFWLSHRSHSIPPGPNTWSASLSATLPPPPASAGPAPKTERKASDQAAEKGEPPAELPTTTEPKNQSTQNKTP